MNQLSKLTMGSCSPGARTAVAAVSDGSPSRGKTCLRVFEKLPKFVVLKEVSLAKRNSGMFHRTYVS